MILQSDSAEVRELKTKLSHVQGENHRLAQHNERLGQERDARVIKGPKALKAALENLEADLERTRSEKGHLMQVNSQLSVDVSQYRMRNHCLEQDLGKAKAEIQRLTDLAKPKVRKQRKKAK